MTAAEGESRAQPLPASWRTRPPGLFEAEAGRLVLRAARCARCGQAYFPARDFCPACRRKGTMTPVRLSGRGTVHTFSVVRQSTPEFTVPYTVAYADLEEGIRVLGQIEGCPPEAVRIGMAVEVVPLAVETDAEGRTVFTYRFRTGAGPAARS